MAFPRARRLPPPPVRRRGCRARRAGARARGQERSAACSISARPSQRRRARRTSAAGSSATATGASPDRCSTPTAQSRFRSLMSELGFAIAPRLMTPADTLGYAGLPVLRRARRHQDQPEPEGRRPRVLGRHRRRRRRRTRRRSRPDSYLTTVGGFVRKGLWLPLPAFEFGAGALNILGLAHVRAAGLREAGAAGRFPRLVAALVRGARLGVAAARHRPRST